MSDLFANLADLTSFFNFQGIILANSINISYIMAMINIFGTIEFPFGNKLNTEGSSRFGC
jgi:hypothetical protein